MPKPSPFPSPASPLEPGYGAASALSPLFLAVLALLLTLVSARAMPAPGSGALVLRSEAAVPVEAPRLATDFAVTVSGPTLRTIVTQAFRNTTDRWVEGTYVYPLPEDAAVDAMTMIVGERVIVAGIKERAAARRVYEAARAEGKTAALTEQERPNVFTNAVANIGPGETVVVRIEIQQAVSVSAGIRTLRLPLVVAPRYNPAPPAATLISETGESADPVPDRDRIEPPVLDPARHAPINPVAITVRLDAGFPVGALRSATHPIRVEETGPTARRVTLGEGVVPADRDFELTWEPAPGAEPSLGLFREEIGGETYVLATLNPPTAAAGTRPPRDVNFVIDNSGSMAGDSRRQAKAGLLAGLARLHPEDRVNVIRFDNTWDALFPEPVPASPETLRRAERFVGALEARGGTEMLAPLTAALNDPTPEDRNRLRQIVFLTDGAVGNEAQLFEAIQRGLGRSRLFMVGIGAAPNGHLMRHAAEIGRGSFTAIHTVDQVAERTRALYAKLEEPAATGLRASFTEEGAEVTPDPLPDLYRGEPLTLAARLAKGTGGLTVSGTVDGRPWSRTLSLSEAAPGTGISKVWARARIGEAETGRITGRLTAEAADAAILKLALAHGLTTRLTSLVAVDATPRRAAGTPLAATDLPLNLPAGWDFEKVFGERPSGVSPIRERHAGLTPAVAPAPAREIRLPQTGIGFLPRLWLGLGLALAGLAVGLLSRRARAAR